MTISRTRVVRADVRAIDMQRPARRTLAWMQKQLEPSVPSGGQG